METNSGKIENSKKIDEIYSEFKFGKINSCRTLKELLDTFDLYVNSKKDFKYYVIDNNNSVAFVGDIHGDYEILLRILEKIDKLKVDKVIFLGDYVDRGYCSIEVLVELVYKYLKNPNRFILLRGNHEDIIINKYYGFEQEIKNKCKDFYATRYLDEVVNRKFYSNLPIVYYNENLKVLALHGNIPYINLNKYVDIRDVLIAINLRDVAQNYTVYRNTNNQYYSLWVQILWNDVCFECSKVEYNIDRGVGYKINVEYIKKFMEKFGLNYIVRAHQRVDENIQRKGISSFKVDKNKYFYTIFSAKGSYSLEKVSILLIEKGKKPREIVVE